MVLFFGGLIVILVVALIFKGINSALHAGLDYESKVSTVKKQVHADEASIAKSKLEKDLHEKSIENNPVKVRVEKAQLEAQYAAARTAKRVAEIAYDMGLDAQTYLEIFKMETQHRMQLELAQTQYLGQKDYEQFKMLLEVELERLKDKNQIDLGVYHEKQQAQLGGAKELRGEDEKKD
jgi:hypothetical protein